MQPATVRVELERENQAIEVPAALELRRGSDSNDQNEAGDEKQRDQQAEQQAQIKRMWDWIVAATVLLLGAGAIFALLLCLQLMKPKRPEPQGSVLNSAGFSSATASEGVLVLNGDCGFLAFGKAGSLVLYEATPSPGIAVPIWSSQPAASMTATTSSGSSSSSTNTSSSSSSSSTTTVSSSAISRGGPASYTLKLNLNGQLLVHAADSARSVLWSNAVSFPASAPFRLQIACSGGGQATLQQTDAYDNVVWQSGRGGAAQGPAFAILKDATADEPLGGFIRVAVDLTPTQRLVGQSPPPGDGGDLLTQAQIAAATAATATATSTTGGNAGVASGAAATAEAQQQGAALPTAAPAAAGSRPSNMVYLDNGLLRVGFDLALGGALAFLATRQEPELNLVSSYDTGRLVQQSYYGSRDNSSWRQLGQPTAWRYNPVQAGSHGAQLGALLDKDLNASSGCFSSRSLPRHWATGELLAEVTMMQTVCLRGRLLEMAFQMKYSGSRQHDAAAQETPAVYVHRSFSDLVTYAGGRPFQQDANLTTYVQAWQYGPVPLKRNATEHWAAYVRPSDKLGIGLFFPGTTTYVAYAYGPPERAAEPWTCSYLAPLSTARLLPGTTVAYKAFLYVGSVPEIRAAFYTLRGGAP